MDQINLVLDTSIIYDLIGLGASACNKKYIRYDKVRVANKYITTFSLFEFLHSNLFCANFADNFNKVKELGIFVDSMSLNEEINDEDLLFLDRLSSARREEIKVYFTKKITCLYAHFFASILAGFIGFTVDLVLKSAPQDNVTSKDNENLSSLCKKIVNQREAVMKKEMLKTISPSIKKSNIYHRGLELLVRDYKKCVCAFSKFASLESTNARLAFDYLKSLSACLSNTNCLISEKESFVNVEFFNTVVEQYYAYTQNINSRKSRDECAKDMFSLLCDKIRYQNENKVLRSYINHWLAVFVGYESKKKFNFPNDIIDCMIATSQISACTTSATLPISSDIAFLLRVKDVNELYSEFVDFQELSTHCSS